MLVKPNVFLAVFLAAATQAGRQQYDCGGYPYLQGNQYTFIYSPLYNNYYPWGSSCSWYTSTLPGRLLKLECQNVDVYPSNDCIVDALDISFTGDASYSIRDSHCGQGVLIYVTQTNVFRAHFFSTFYNPWSYPYNLYYNGFHCKLSSIPDPNGYMTESSTQGIISTTEAGTGISSTSEAGTGINSTTEAGTGISSTTEAGTGTATATNNFACGVPIANRIVNGEESDLHEWPWQVMLRWMSNSQHFCAGTLIANEWVLTAAHCVHGFNDNSIFVSLGEHNKYDSGETDQTIHASIAEVIEHEEYDSDTVNNDIALIRINYVPYSEGIAPVCLPCGLENTLFGTATATGWGNTAFNGPSTDVLHEVVLDVISTSDCIINNYYPGKITSNMFCALTPNKDTCQGDSGGPLSWNSGNFSSWSVIGIVSWGEGCANDNKPGVYTKVTNYLSWIEDKTGLDFCS